MIRTVVFAVSALFAPTLHAEDHHHSHPAAETAPVMHLDEGGKKWATDATLRDGMTKLRQLVTAKGRDTPAKLRAEIQALVKACKLPPKADATLHVVIGALMKGADDLENGKSAEPTYEAMASALARYGDYFDHPGW